VNNLTLKYKISGAVAILLVTFALGRYSVNVVSVKTKESVAQVDVKKDTQNVVTKTHEVETKKPDGTVQTTIDTTIQAVTKNDDKETQTDKVDQTVTAAKTSTVNISLLAGYHYGDTSPLYGASVSKELLGPITIGLFGLTNGTVGASVGVNF